MNKTIKCLISLMLVFSMIFTTMVGVVSAAPLTVADIVDVEDPQFDIVHLLVKLGVFKEGDEFPASMSESISRAEFVEYAMRLHRYSDLDVSGTTELRYTDIDSSHKYYKTILLAAALDVLTYDEYDLTFKPDDYITFDEGLAVVINAAGYKEYALHTGEYPSSYRVLATSLGLYDSLDPANNDGIMTYETACQLLFNAFTAPLFEVTSTSQLTGETFWQMNETKSILSEKHNIYEVEGVLTANDAASILPGVSAERGTARIGNTLYYNDNADEAVYDYLGYNVRAFYYDDEGRKELIYVGLIGKKNSVFVLPYEDISDVRKSGSNVIISYWDDNDNIDTITISPSTAVLFNDKAYNSSEIYKEWFHGDTFNNRGLLNNGEIVFLNNGGSNDYDVAFIYEYNTTIVDTVNVDDRYIYDIDDAACNIDLNHSANAMYYAITDAAGNKLDIADLKQWDVLSVAQSADGRVVKIKVARKSQNVIISAKHNGEKVLTIGTKDYNAGERIDMDEIVLGEQVTVYYDVFGDVAYAEKVATAGGKSVAYLVSIGKSGRSSLSRDIDVLIVKPKENETTTYRLAETFILDGKTTKAYSTFVENSALANDVDPACQLFERGPRVKHQPILYSLNDNNEIDYIDTAYLGADEDEDETLYRKFENVTLYLKSGYFSDSGKKYPVMPHSTSKLSIFYVPTKVDDFENYKSTHLTLGEEVNHKGDYYTIGKFSITPVVYVEVKDSVDNSLVGSFDEYAPPRFVEKILRTVYKNEDGDEEVGYKLCLMDTDAKTTSIILSEDNETLKKSSTDTTTVLQVVETLDVGDIVITNADSDGFLDNVARLYDWDTNTFASNVNTSFSGERTYFGGPVYHKEPSYYTLCTDTAKLGTSNEQETISAFPLSDTGTVNIFDVQNGKLKYKAGTKKDVIDIKTYGLSEATYSFVNARWSSPQKRLFFKNHTGTGASTDVNFGKYPAYFVESATVTNVINTQRADAGETITIPDNTLPAALADGTTTLEIPGFNFLGWTDGQNTYVPGDTYTMPEATVIFYPVWGAANTVTFVASEPTGSTVTGTTPVVGNFSEGQTFTIPGCTFNVFGYEFIKWNDGTNDYVPGDTYTMPSGPVTFSAVWEAGEVATFDNGVDSISVRAGRTFELPEMTATIRGKIFEHWTDGSQIYTPGATYTMPVGGVAFTSVWRDGVAIDLVYNSKTETQTLNAIGDTITLPSESDLNGYALEGWSADNGTTIIDAGSTYTIASASETLKAVYTKNLTFSEWFVYSGTSIETSGTLGRNNGSHFLTTLDISSVDMTPFKAQFGFSSKFQNSGSCYLHIKPVTGSYSTAFNVGDTFDSISNITGLTIGSDIAVTPQISADPRVNGSAVYIYGEFDANIAPYVISQRTIGKTSVQLAMNLSGGNSSGDGLRNTPSTAFVKVYVIADASPIVVGTLSKATFTGGNDATGTAPADIELVSNNSFALPANTFEKVGYRFAGWSDGTTTYPAGDTFTFGSTDVEFTAQWVKTYTVTFENGDASATGTMATVTQDENSIFTVPECDFAVGGMAFTSWSDGTTTYQPNDTFTLTGNVTLTANWLASKTIFFSAGTVANGTQESENVVVGGSYTIPSTTTFTSKNLIGSYTLSGWTDGTNNYTLGQQIQVNDDLTLTPVFAYACGVADQKIPFTNTVHYQVNNEGTETSLAFNTNSVVQINTAASDFGDNGYFMSIDLGSIPDIQSAKLSVPYIRYKYGTIKVYDVTSGWDGGSTLGGISMTEGSTTTATSGFTKPTITELVSFATGNTNTSAGEWADKFDATSYLRNMKDAGKTTITWYITHTQSGSDGAVGANNNKYNRLWIYTAPNAAVPYLTIDSTEAPAQQYTLTFEGNEGDVLSGTAIAPVTQNENTTFEIPANVYAVPTAVAGSYAFGGWTDGTTTVQPGEVVTLTANKTYKPVWTYTGTGNSGAVLNAAETWYSSEVKGTAAVNPNYQSATAGDIVAYTSENYLTLMKNRASYAFVKVDLTGIKADNLSSAVLTINYDQIKAASKVVVEGVTEAAYNVAFPLSGTKTLPAVESTALFTSDQLSTSTTAGTVETTDIAEYIKAKITAGQKAVYLRVSFNDGGTGANNGFRFNGATLKVVTQ